MAKAQVIGAKCGCRMTSNAGAKVIATARSRAKADIALALGADVAIDVSQEDFADVANANGGCDVILDMVGGDYFDRNFAALKTGGRITYIAARGGADVTLNLALLMWKHAAVMGSTLRSRNADEKARLAEAVEATVWPWIAAGLVRPRMDQALPLAQAAAAHARMQSGQNVGNIVLVI